MKKTLVAFFSASGTTKKIAEMIAEAANADLHEIAPKVLYTKDGLNWMNKKSRSSIEMSDKSIRPEIADSNLDMESYDEIILGFPIWWYVAPTIINTFLESYDLTGKKIYPVSQSASMDRSQYEESVTFIRGCAKGASVEEGIFSKDNTAIQNYVNQIIND